MRKLFRVCFVVAQGLMNGNKVIVKDMEKVGLRVDCATILLAYAAAKQKEQGKKASRVRVTAHSFWRPLSRVSRLFDLERPLPCCYVVMEENVKNLCVCHEL